MTLVLILALVSLVLVMALFAAALSIDGGEPIHILALTLCSTWAGFILGSWAL
jgi:hypothetical protein